MKAIDLKDPQTFGPASLPVFRVQETSAHRPDLHHSSVAQNRTES